MSENYTENQAVFSVKKKNMKQGVARFTEAENMDTLGNVHTSSFFL